VRADGEELSDTIDFTVDATPPAVTFISSLGPTGADPPLTTPSGNASFVFTAADQSPVTYECLLSFSAASGGPAAPTGLRATVGPAGKPYSRLAGAPEGAEAPPLGKWAPCRSPLTLWGLTYGEWGLQVRATDAASNRAEPVAARWVTAYAPEQRYARVLRGSYGLVNSPDLEFGVGSFAGGAGGAPDAAAAAPVEWALLLGGTTPGLPVGLKWQPGASAAITVKEDGAYTFLARPVVEDGDEAAEASLQSGRWPDGWAVMSLTVDTTPPTVAISQRPAALQSAPTATVKFTSPDADEFTCRWLHSDAGAPDPAADQPPFAPCAGATPGTAAANVSEGFWLFQVRGTDAAGNVGPPASVPFRTDLSPPKLASIKFPNATNAGFVTLEFAVDDGPLGSGVANVSCRMSLAANAPPGAEGSAGEGGVEGAGPAPAGARAADGQWLVGCVSPVRCVLVCGCTGGVGVVGGLMLDGCVEVSA